MSVPGLGTGGNCSQVTLQLWNTLPGKTDRLRKPPV